MANTINVIQINIYYFCIKKQRTNFAFNFFILCIIYYNKM